MINELKDRLFKGKHSCVIANGDDIRTFSQSGIRDLYHLWKEEPEFLKGAIVADKIIGKAAAALLILGGVKEIYSDVIGLSALSFLSEVEVKTTFSQAVPYIKNRDNTGMCPLERMCMEKRSPLAIVEIIEEFAQGILSKAS